MSFEIVFGDLLDQNVHTIVTTLIPFSGPCSKYSNALYYAAGYDELLEARKGLGELSDNQVGVTSGFNLIAKKIIHVSVPEWFGGFLEEPKLLTYCYINALKEAEKMDVPSIAFPLLGSGKNRVPLSTAFRIAYDTIDGYVRSHYLKMDVYLILKESILKYLSSEQIDIINRFSENKERNVVDANLSSPKEIFYKYIDRIKNPTAFATAIDYAPSTISRIVNKTGKGRPNKNTILSIAIGLQLSKDERHDFINSVHYPYPFDKRDQRLEELLDQYHKEYNIRKINAILAAENPDWTLMNKSKSSDLKEKTTKHRQKQYELDI